MDLDLYKKIREYIVKKPELKIISDPSETMNEKSGAIVNTTTVFVKHLTKPPVKPYGNSPFLEEYISQLNEEINSALNLNGESICKFTRDLGNSTNIVYQSEEIVNLEFETKHSGIKKIEKKYLEELIFMVC